MPPVRESYLRLCAEVIVRVGLNLQRGQRLLIAEPYELQGVSRDARDLVDAVSVVALEAGCPRPEVLWGDPSRLRQYAEQADWTGFTQLVAADVRRMKANLAAGGAMLFPISSFPRLMDGIAADRVGELRRIAWTHFGPIVQRLTRGESQWTLVPASAPAWADAAFADLPAEHRLAALEKTVWSAMRIPTAGGTLSPDSLPSTTTALADWQNHLAALNLQCEELNARRYKTVRYQGAGTDLTLKLPVQHRWCTAHLTTKRGIAFVANLPTEEVFTAPDRNSAEGIVRVSRPVNYGGRVIEGIELEFRHGSVVEARARSGAELLQRLLDTDDGARRLGEVAVVKNAGANAALSAEIAAQPSPVANWQTSGRLFYHTLLDENVANHIALGESYPFCSRAFFASGLNRSLVHVDLPLDAAVTFA